MQKLIQALKEWQVAVGALERGETIMLVRKGGIREVGGKFAIAHDRVLLYPTYEHQKPELLKPAYASQVEPVASGWHPTTVRIGSWAQITDTIQVVAAETMDGLLPFHIWNPQFVHDRWQWKPNQPLYVLALRVYQLLQPQEIPYDPSYGGCKSWIDLTQAIAVENSTPVLTNQDYATLVAKLQAVVATQ